MCSCGEVDAMGSLRKFLNDLTARKCIKCGVKLVEGATYFIEYPIDLYCLTCAKQHPNYRR
jgi:hypothetical protein